MVRWGLYVSSRWASVAAAMICIFTTFYINPVLAQENSGKHLYHTGQGATALVMQGKIKVPASRFPCANCHGEDGMGSREGGSIIPPINWNSLQQQTVNRPAYTVQSFRQAVIDGVGADGRELSEVMPRFDIEQETLSQLIGYLQKLDVEQRMGVSADAIQVMLPKDADARLGFEAAIKRFNLDGGSYGRTIRLTEQNTGFLSADSVDQHIKSRLDSVAFRRLIKSVYDDGHSSVAFFPEEPGQQQHYELEQAGLQYDPEAVAVVFTDHASLSDASLNAWLNRSTLLNHSRVGSADTAYKIYSAASSVAPYAQKILNSDHELVIVDYDEQAVRWALSKQLSARAASGFTAGTLLGQAVLRSGRDPTRVSVMRSLENIDLQDHAFIWRTGQE